MSFPLLIRSASTGGQVIDMPAYTSEAIATADSIWASAGGTLYRVSSASGTIVGIPTPGCLGAPRNLTRQLDGTILATCETGEEPPTSAILTITFSPEADPHVASSPLPPAPQPPPGTGFGYSYGYGWSRSSARTGPCG